MPIESTSVLSLIPSKRLRYILDTNQRLTAEFSELALRLQHIERELMSARLRCLFGELGVAIRLTVQHGLDAADAMENGLRATVRPLARGKAGGIARAMRAWRYLDGTFMPEKVKEQAFFEEYERYAAGGRARAATAKRGVNGSFLPKKGMGNV